MDSFEAFKETLSEASGIPAVLLTGDTVEEVQERAETLKQWKNERQPQQKPIDISTLPVREQFACWMNGVQPVEAVPDPAAPVNKYPIVKDGGEIPVPTTPQKTRDLFADFFCGSVGIF